MYHDVLGLVSRSLDKDQVSEWLREKVAAFPSADPTLDPQENPREPSAAIVRITLVKSCPDPPTSASTCLVSLLSRQFSAALKLQCHGT